MLAREAVDVRKIVDAEGHKHDELGRFTDGASAAKVDVKRTRGKNGCTKVSVEGSDSSFLCKEKLGLLDIDRIKTYGEDPKRVMQAVAQEVHRRKDVVRVCLSTDSRKDLDAAVKELGPCIPLSKKNEDWLDQGYWVHPAFEVRNNRVKSAAAKELEDAHKLTAQMRYPGREAAYIEPPEGMLRDAKEAIDATLATLDGYKPMPSRLYTQACKYSIFNEGHAAGHDMHVSFNPNDYSDAAVDDEDEGMMVRRRARIRETVVHEMAHILEEASLRPHFEKFCEWMNAELEKHRDKETRQLDRSRYVSAHGVESGNTSAFHEDWAIALTNYILRHELTGGAKYHMEMPERQPLAEVIEKIGELVGKPMKWEPGEREKMRTFEDK